jgi:hypothetical protein
MARHSLARAAPPRVLRRAFGLETLAERPPPQRATAPGQRLSTGYVKVK